MNSESPADAHVSTPDATSVEVAEEFDHGSDDAVEAVSFASLGVAPALVDALAAGGITSAFAIQTLSIADALSGRDVCGKAKTGSGKTLAFSVPLLQRTMAAVAARTADANRAKPSRPAHPVGLILVPTRELAVQVFTVVSDLAQRLSISVLAVYGGTDIERQIKKLHRGIDIIIATPGRLIDLGDRGEVDVSTLEILVLDEADRMADMGFMPQVEWVLRRLDAPHQTLLFSATLDGAVDRLVKRHMNDPVFHEVASDTQTVKNMTHHFFQVHQMDKVKVAAAISRGVEKSLVFVRTKRGADRLVEQLQKEGIKAGAIHGDLRQNQRERTLAEFSAGKLPVLVATDVAARGIHIDAVDVVIHYDPPEDHKAYLHRSGRTARAGTSGVVVNLLAWNQVVEAEQLQRKIELSLPIVEMFSNDPALKDLASFEPSWEGAVLKPASAAAQKARPKPRGQAMGARRRGRR